MPIFTRLFDAGLQEQFETAVQTEDYKTASEILQRFPPSKDPRAFPEAEQPDILLI